ncbi:replication factor C small subunit [Candidatus Woesearchaeota archaeon]|nr:replication factor C small subunit [Candidatus Woesearchaeota archaeon]
MTLTIWTEKYRPREFSEIHGQQEIIKRIEALVRQKNLPHLLFTGPAGVGKTTTALVISRTLFGEEWKNNVLELNASDERGIDVIRNKVKDFARTKAIGQAPFKIIYLDECDALTREAQQALRRTMENFTQTTRFILSANYSSKIIDPIQSRCAMFRFKPLEKKEIFAILEGITQRELLTITDTAKEALYDACGGDCRKLENLLQSCASLTSNLDEDVVFSMASMAKPAEIKTMLTLAIQNKFIDARSMLLKTMVDYGLAGIDIIKQIQKEILDLSIDGRTKMKLISACGECEFRLSEGSDEYLQLEAFLAKVALAGTAGAKTEREE